MRLPYLCVNKVGCKNMNAKIVNDRKLELKDKTIARQAKEIESLKTEISKLKSDCDEKDRIISEKENEGAEFAAVIDHLRGELNENINELKMKSKEYDDNLAEIRQMRKVFAKDVFKGEWRWHIVKWLMK